MNTDTKKNRKDLGNALPFLEKLNGGPLTFGQMLASIRRRERMSLAEMGEKLGISRAYLSNIEQGRKNISGDAAKRFAKILKRNPDFFVKLALRSDVDKLIEKSPKGLRAELKRKIWSVFFPDSAKEDERQPTRPPSLQAQA